MEEINIMKILLNEEDLVCKYFNPIEEMYDLEYLRLAKIFLNAYHRQKIPEEPYYPSIENTFAEMLSFIYDKCVSRWKYEYERRMEELEKRNEELKKIKYLESNSLIPSLINFNSSIVEFLNSYKLGFIYDAIVKVTATSAYFIISELMLRRINGVFRQPDKSILLNELDKLLKNREDPSKFLLEIQKYVSHPKVKGFIDHEISIDELYVKRLAKKLKRVRKNTSI